MRAFVIWHSEPTAFTPPGRSIYISRELLSRGLSEAGTAFVLAHEMAHHELGHYDVLKRWLVKLGDLPGALAAALIVQGFSRLHRQVEQETEADARAFDLVRRAGYADDAGFEVFRLLEHYFLDYGELDVVFGSEDEDEDEQKAPNAIHRALKRLASNFRSHPPLRERCDALERLRAVAPVMTSPLRPVPTQRRRARPRR
jgi:Zn-dependent protease with chaperone function